MPALVVPVGTNEFCCRKILLQPISSPAKKTQKKCFFCVFQNPLDKPRQQVPTCTAALNAKNA
jgi:hypothetical protein